MTTILNELQSLLFLTTLLLTYYDAMVKASTQGAVYRKMGTGTTNDSTVFRLGTPGEIWKSTSIADCARRCSQKGADCSAVEFDEMSGNCTSGMVVIRGNGTSQHEQRRPWIAFYSRLRSYCDETLGFSYIIGKNEKERACLFVSRVETTRDEATGLCEQMNTVLYLSKTAEKFGILSQNRGGNTGGIWVGMRDISGSLTLFWDDGEPADVNDPHWRSGRPNADNKRCVSAYGADMKYYDMTCTILRRYACELCLN